jgi:cell division protein FtsB
MDLRVIHNSRQRLRSRVPLPAKDETVRQAGEYVLHAVQASEPVWRPAYQWRNRILTVVASVLAVWLLFHVVFGANGMLAYGSKRAEYRNLRQDIQLLQQDNETLEKNIKSLKSDPETIEREAREQLHYAKPGEVVYVAPAPPPPPANATAHK